MASRQPKILLVQPNPEPLECLVAALTERFNALLTCVADTESCLDVELRDPHDLIIADVSLEDPLALKAVAHLASLGPRPVILIAHDPTGPQAIEAMQCGVVEIVSQPFSIDDLAERTARRLREHNLRCQHAARYGRMRAMLRRVIQERRYMNQRIELLCRDLVNAQRRLVHRVVALEGKL